MPKISVVMANYCNEKFIGSAIQSVLRQTHEDLEVLVVDDASPDASVARIGSLAATDRRVKLIEAPCNGGAAAARNLALEQATGDWLAIVDGDDILHPQRFARMLAAAKLHDVPMVADDMLFFSESPEGAGRTLLQEMRLTEPWQIGLAEMAGSEDPGRKLPKLGYLKMLVSRGFCGSQRYDETMPVAEDFDFYLRLMARGGACLVLPDPMYLYRRHSASLSYRLTVPALRAMLDAQERLSADASVRTALGRMLPRRKAALKRALAYQELVESIQDRDALDASRQLLRKPSLLKELAGSVRQRLERRTLSNSDRTARTLTLGETPRSVDTCVVERSPLPGHPWKSPPSVWAAELSRMATMHDLSVEVADEAGIWALWLVPSYAQACLTGDARPDASLPLPEGTSIGP